MSSKLSASNKNLSEFVCEGQFKGFVLDPVSNHIGMCLKNVKKIEAQPSKPNQTKKLSLFRQINNKIQSLMRPKLETTMFVQIARGCLTDWEKLKPGVSVVVQVSKPKTTNTSNMPLQIEMHGVNRYRPWLLKKLSIN